MNRIIYSIFFLLLLVVSNLRAQSVETGFVKQYNGKETKTPISGVEIYASGASSTATDRNGAFSLRFNTLKAGDKVSNPEIYKEGYVVFNKDVVNVWRISNKKAPFYVIMCKEQQFRELKRKYYGLLNNFYQKDYTKKCNQVKSLQFDKNKLSEKLDSLERDYKKKLENIESYVDMFSRLDRESLDKNMEEALSLLEAGKIDEAIKKYEALELTKHTVEQMRKWESGAELIESGEKMQAESYKDMIALSAKLKQQIAAYEIGGIDYVEKKIESLDALISLYRILCAKSDSAFQKDLAESLCQKGDLLLKEKERMKFYRESAKLGSYHGWLALGEMYENLVYQKRSNAYLDSMRTCYATSMKLTPVKDTLQLAKEHLQKIYDFGEPNELGDTLFYKIVGSEEVALNVRCKNCYNIVDSVLVIPDEVRHNGVTYKISSINSQAFAFNYKLKKVIVGIHCKEIANDAFEECGRLDSIIVKNTVELENYNVPDYVELVLTGNLSKEENDKIKEMLHNRMLSIKSINRAKLSDIDQKMIIATLHMYESLLEQSKYITHNDSLEIQMNIASLYRKNTKIKDLDHSLLLHETLKKRYDDERVLFSMIDCLRECEKFEEAYLALDKIGNAMPYTLLLCVSLKNSEAYSYAKRGDFLSAHRTIDEAIAINEKLSGFFDSKTELYDSKGELYLMEEKIDSAIIYRDKILAINPKFVTTHVESVLFKKLGSSNNLDLLRHWVTIVQDVEKEILNECINEATNGYRNFSYEELVSIGILCVQAFIKGKTWDELSKFDDNRLSMLIKHVTRSELRYRKTAYMRDNLVDLKQKKTNEMLSILKSEDFIIHAQLMDEEAVDYVVLKWDDWTNGDTAKEFLSSLSKNVYDTIVLIPSDYMDVNQLKVLKHLKKGDIHFSVQKNENNMRKLYKELYEKYVNK